MPVDISVGSRLEQRRKTRACTRASRAKSKRRDCRRQGEEERRKNEVEEERKQREREAMPDESEWYARSGARSLSSSFVLPCPALVAVLGHYPPTVGPLSASLSHIRNAHTHTHT